ncbi:MAG: methyltransferase [Rhodobacteraceae bacterium PARR1]|nr:MAG: methyltransferase [Rhodobacteraceae bacterium PARR1]
MTALANLLAARIAATGPITLAEYMTDCLLHPQHGYYATRDPFGAGGDFTTAPEISQMFGELLGLSLAQAWLDQGSPAFTLAELGPGRGTLMADVLRATRGVPGFHAAARVHLVEASATLRGVQRQTLGDHAVIWAASVQDLPADAPLFVLANEFFDALPIRQFTRQGQGWAETVVGLRDGRLTLGRSAPAPLAALAHRLTDTRDGDVVETCPAAGPIVAAISSRIAQNGGAAIIMDYGDWQSLGDTFQALKDHRYTDPLAAPGEADLTAHVDFAALAAAAHPARTSRMIPQGVLLERLGMAARSARLAQSLTGASLTAHLAATRRLTDPAEMGSLFKALALYRDTPPAGFDP